MQYYCLNIELPADADSSTNGDDVMQLHPLLHKVQTEVTHRYHEITQQP